MSPASPRAVLTQVSASDSLYPDLARTNWALPRQRRVLMHSERDGLTGGTLGCTQFAQRGCGFGR